MSIRSAALVSISILLGAAQASAAAEPAPAPTAGTWHPYERSFVFMGFTSMYSCDGLGDKLKLLLREAGARDDLKVSAGCSDPSRGPSRIATARLRFHTLMPNDAAQALSVAPVKGEAPAAPEPGLGVWKSVEIRDRKPWTVEDGDCELVEQFARELLPLFATRNVDSQMRCIPHQRSIGGVNLRFESFAPLPAPKAPKAPKTAKGGAAAAQ